MISVNVFASNKYVKYKNVPFWGKSRNKSISTNPSVKTFWPKKSLPVVPRLNW